MSRRPDPERKPQLIAEIIDYLSGRSLGNLTFRTLADHLGVSTFTLVYHFGTKTQLIADVVEAVCDRQHDAFDDAEISTSSVDDYFESFRSYWEWVVDPVSRSLQRIEFEAAMIESLDASGDTVTRSTLAEWHRVAMQGMRSLGVPADLVAAESRAMANTVYGLQYDLIVLGDLDRVNEAFESALSAWRHRVSSLVRQS